MSNYSWRFPNLDNGPEQGINDGGITTFKGSELYNNLAREICQNSLDAKAEGFDSVTVKFKSVSLNKNDYPELFELDDVFKECEEYWEGRTEPKLKSFLDEANSKLSNDKVDLLIISDYNTTGLSGAKAGKKEKSKWRALTHSNGVTEKSSGSGGSYGIGKNAPFACSSFRTVFYNSYARKDKLKAFQGVARLITHTHNNFDTQGSGFYQNTECQQPIFENDISKLRDYIDRKDFGTDVVIAGFKKSDSWAEDIEKAILSNFFVAISRGTLKVSIDDVDVDNNNIRDRIKYYADKEENSKDKRISTILEFYYALTESDVVVSGSIAEENDVDLYIKKDDSYSKSIAEMRSIGMVIRTRHHNIYTRYAAVMIVKDGALNNLLKEIEPPAHDKWDPGIIEDDELKRKEADKYRKRLIAWVNNSIIEQCRSEDSDELDLDGISAFLPFDEDDKSLGLTDESDSQDIDANSRFNEPKKSKPNVKKTNLGAQKVKGVKDDDMDPHNNAGGGSGGGHGGHEDPNGDDDVTVPKQGTKSVNIPVVLRQRIVAMPNYSSYRVSFVLENDCEKVNISVRAIGDDGNKEPLKIKNYKFNKASYNAEANIITLSNVSSKENHEVFLNFEQNEKMALELIIS